MYHDLTIVLIVLIFACLFIRALPLIIKPLWEKVMDKRIRTASRGQESLESLRDFFSKMEVGIADYTEKIEYRKVWLGNATRLTLADIGVTAEQLKIIQHRGARKKVFYLIEKLFLPQIPLINNEIASEEYEKFLNELHQELERAEWTLQDFCLNRGWLEILRPFTRPRSKGESLKKSNYHVGLATAR